MDIKAWLRAAKTQINPLDAELIALQCFAPRGVDRSWLAAHDTEQITAKAQQTAAELLRRRAQGEPLAYILGQKEFYGRKFHVLPGVLIPRPETEAIIDTVKTLELPPRPSFLEIGTGSGCIAITLALEFPQSQVLASDISPRALDIAQLNDARHEGRIELVRSNLFRELGFLDEREHFNVVVANLPYVNRDWDWLDQQALSYEPSQALYANGLNGLSLYRKFFNEINFYQNSNQMLVDYVAVEADPCQHADLIKMAEKSGLHYLQTNGFCVLFEDGWRYWFDSRQNKYVHKPAQVIQRELETGEIHWLPEQVDFDE